MRKLTQAIARQYIRMLGGRFRRDEYGDFRVKFGNDEYFASDLDDAIGTARIMAGGNVNFDEAEEYLKLMRVEVRETRGESR